MRVLVRGVGDVGSAVAHRLFRAGFAVVLHDGPHPATTRRRMAFADAIFDGQAALDGVTAIRVDTDEGLRLILDAGAAIPVTVADLGLLLDLLRPDILIDARMRKRATPEDQRGLAPLIVGLGPGFVAGGNVHLAVETDWDDLGKLVRAGPTRPLAGEPRPIGGVARERYVYAPVAGTFRTGFDIGAPVEIGEAVARIGEAEIVAPIAGVLRGVVRDGVPVAAGTKVVEVDPRGAAAVVAGVGERPGRIADAVLVVVLDMAGDAARMGGC